MISPLIQFVADDMARGDQTAAWHAAVAAYEKNPQGYLERLALGAVLAMAGRPKESLPLFYSCLEENPRDCMVYSNIANSWRTLGNRNLALEWTERGLRINPAYPHLRWNMACMWLEMREYDMGWKEYEWGFHPEVHTRQMPFPSKQMWAGQDGEARKRSLMLWTEQGVGDTLMMGRFAMGLRDRFLFKRVMLVGHRPTHSFLTRRMPGVRAVSYNMSAYDREMRDETTYHLGLMSLPRVLGLDTYKKVHDYSPLWWQPSTPWKPEPGPLRVGVCWRGNPKQSEDWKRSAKPAHFAPLLDMPGVQCYAVSPALENVYGLLPYTGRSYRDTEQLMLQMDMIVTVDTSVAHMAGALGLPTVVLLPPQPYWPYGDSGEETPWYPTMKLLRCPEAQRWEGPVSQAVELVRNAAALKDRGRGD